MNDRGLQILDSIDWSKDNISQYKEGDKIEYLYRFVDKEYIDSWGCKWDAPANGKPGKWQPITNSWIGPGGRPMYEWQLFRPTDLPFHVGSNRSFYLYEAEYKGDIRPHDNLRINAKQARLTKQLDWNEENARLYACDCIEFLLRWNNITECSYPYYNEVVSSLKVLRDYAVRDATRSDLLEVYFLCKGILEKIKKPYIPDYWINGYWPDMPEAGPIWGIIKACNNDFVAIKTFETTDKHILEWQVRRLFEYLYSE